MTRQERQRYLAMLLGMVMLMQTGCALLLVGAGAAGGTAYVMGELTATKDIAFDAAWARTQAVIDELEFFKIGETKDALFAKLTARTAEDKKVRITLKKQTETLTEIKIRVGMIGDEGLSMHILSKIAP